MLAEFWVKIQAKKKWNQWACGAVVASKSKPATEEDEVAVKVNFTIPDNFFEKPQIVANVVIPEDSVNRPEITADVQDNISVLLMEELGVNVHVSVKDPTEH